MTADGNRRRAARAPGGRGQTRLHLSLAAVAGLLVTAQAPAADWELQPSIRLAETWTDNLTLAAEDEDPEEEWITEIAPGIRLDGEGRRVRLSLAYQVQALIHDDESERDRTNHRLAAESEVELVRESLFFDADAARTLDTGGPGLSAPASALIGGGGRNTVTTWSAGPRLRDEWGRFARFEAQARRRHVDRDTGGDDGTETDEVSAELTSGPVFRDWGWALNASRSEQTSERAGGADDEVIFERASAELNLRVGAVTQLFAVGGTENNEFVTAEQGDDATEGDFWEAGVRWNPRRNISLEAAVGERFFGETARLAFNAVGPALSLSLQATEDIVTTPQLRFERTELLVRDQDGNLLLDPEGQPVTVVIDVPTVEDDVFVQRTVSAGIGYERGYSELSLNALATDREFQREGTSEQSEQLGARWAWTRLARTTLSTGVVLREQEFAQSGREDEQWTFDIDVSRNVGANTSTSVTYEQTERDSSADGNEFENRRLTFALEHRF